MSEDRKCGHPCGPNNPCDECADYWARMIREGYWDDVLHQWTRKGIEESMK
jgi:hypothetical protein